MSYTIKPNESASVIAQKGAFSIVENEKDFSVDYGTAEAAYFASKMNVRTRQVYCDLSVSPVTVQAGAMQMMVGDVNAKTNIKSAGDFLKKHMKGKVTNESTIKPVYEGQGTLILEPTRKYLLLFDVSQWGSGMVVEDGSFLACETSTNSQVVARKNLSSAMLGGEGLFNMCFSGSGTVCVESRVPREELVEIQLNNDVLKIDGSMAVAWSKDLNFYVSRTTKSLVGSAASGEGLVNVYEGTGKVLVAPINNPNFLNYNLVTE